MNNIKELSEVFKQIYAQIEKENTDRAIEEDAEFYNMVYTDLKDGAEINKCIDNDDVGFAYSIRPIGNYGRYEITRKELAMIYSTCTDDNMKTKIMSLILGGNE